MSTNLCRLATTYVVLLPSLKSTGPAVSRNQSQILCVQLEKRDSTEGGGVVDRRVDRVVVVGVVDRRVDRV